MAARVIADPLALACTVSRGRRRSFTLNLAYLPCPAVVRELAEGLARLVHPHGELNAWTTLMHYRRGIAQLSRFLHQAGFTGGVGELSKGQLIEFWLAHPTATERLTRAMLRAFDEQAGALRPEVREYLGGPALRPVKFKPGKPYAPYSDTEWDQLRRCCESIVAEAIADQKAALAEARTGQDPRVGGWEPMANRLWLMQRRGPMTGDQADAYLAVRRGQAWTWGPPLEAVRRLFPTMRVALAFRLLLGMTSGIVPDGLDHLQLGDVEWAGDATVLLEYVKGRTRRESVNLPAEAVRVLRRWLEFSALLRSFAPPAHRSALWLAYTPSRTTFHVPRFSWHATTTFVREEGLVGDDGKPLRIHKSRIRTTFQQRRDKSTWTGRTTIDPNHSARVEGNHYLTPVTPGQRDALESIMESAQSDLLGKASASLVLSTDDDLVRAAAELPGRVEHLQLTDAVVRELVGGERDVFSAACSDQLAGLHGPKGTPCPARPWVCLLCPLAVFAPRHAPNLLRLKAFFARQFRQMLVPQFMTVFGQYAHRLDHDILPRFAPAVLAAAAAEVSNHDDELPLRPEETTS